MKNSLKTRSLFSYALATSLLLGSCQTDENLNPEEQNNSNEQIEEKAIIQINGDDVEVIKTGDHYMLEGDIKIPANIVNSKSAGLTNQLWPNNTVFYTISKDMPNQSRITNAIAHWEENTPIRFVKRVNEKDYVNFKPTSGCYSYVGRQGGSQDIGLQKECDTGAVIHEIGHAIGLYHEQNRKDRNEHVKILFENIEAGKESNFQKYSTGKDYTSFFDFGSIMMYPNTAFSKNGKATIVRTNGKSWTGNETKLSDGDITGVKKMYETTPVDKGGIFRIKGNNNRFVSSEKGAIPMTCNRDIAQDPEKFQIIDAGKGKVYLKSTGKYVSSENGKSPMRCNRSNPLGWEKFTIIPRGNNKYALRGSNGKYVSRNGLKPMVCDRDEIKAWEEFVIIK